MTKITGSPQQNLDQNKKVKANLGDFFNANVLYRFDSDSHSIDYAKKLNLNKGDEGQVVNQTKLFLSGKSLTVSERNKLKPLLINIYALHEKLKEAINLKNQKSDRYRDFGSNCDDIRSYLLTLSMYNNCIAGRLRDASIKAPSTLPSNKR